MPQPAQTEKVILVKKDGRKIADVHVIVSSSGVFIGDGTLPIDRGDHLVRFPGTDREEVFRVVDPGRRPAISMFKEHYQAKVEKVDAGDAETVAADWRYFLQAPAPEVLKEARRLIFENCERSRQSELLLLVDDLEKTRGTSGYAGALKTFIRQNAEHLNVLSPVLPALAEWL